ncbi:DUF7079 family protein [Pseudomonas turukhanskensis]|uniref:DUF7079 domain-containing protein n=1 Tax=Pseudomonas turukhanskensis TaxID=1806536 RepID=A0A9W6NF79_9PSED|nr:hypothetical protein [Pseudomonas turukhanskensis]GLK88540.1 hypothetical protein GCM10017655_16020 [Pseudomonas turukhanskensis]
MASVEPRRLALWRAFSSLFLDTDIDDQTFTYIARVVLETGYSPEQVQHILWAEVFPVLAANLRSVAGEWAGWSDAWLLENLQVMPGPARKGWGGSVRKEIARCWAEVAARLPPEFA